QLLAPEGRLVQIATQQGSKVEFDLRQLLVKRITLTGSTLRAQSNEVKSRIAANFFQATQQAFVLRQLRPFIQQIFPLTEVDKAHQLMQEGQLMGKLILKIIA
ncbi:MAG TPA: zinc-binding dehydrogenase, partial [Alphaproteobacteria bacterium]|nr:zinc-binding dehydrogenase [Alphaproteobacteria bacterium]